jgi:hypothetical protein
VAFDQVFEAAGILAEERDRVTRTRPAPAPRLARPGRQETDCRASLEAFGVPIDRIIEMGAPPGWWQRFRARGVLHPGSLGLLPEPRRSCSKFMEVLAVFDASSRRLLLPK